MRAFLRRLNLAAVVASSESFLEGRDAGVEEVRVSWVDLSATISVWQKAVCCARTF